MGYLECKIICNLCMHRTSILSPSSVLKVMKKAIAQNISRETFAIHQKSAKTTKLFSHLTFARSSTVCGTLNSKLMQAYI